MVAGLRTIKVDKTAPNPPTATADRAPDYAGGGGWYKDTVTVSFTSNGDPLLSDGSAGSGVDASTLSGAADVQHRRLAHARAARWPTTSATSRRPAR